MTITNIKRTIAATLIVLLTMVASLEFLYVRMLQTDNYNLRCQMHGGHRYEQMEICVDNDNRIIKM